MFPFQKQCLIMWAVNHYSRLMPILLCFTNTCLLFTTSGITIFGDVMRIDEILSAEVLLWWNWLIRGLSLNAFWNVQLALHLCYVLHICISIVQVLHLDIIICCSHYKWCISYLLLTKKKRCIYIRKVLWKKWVYIITTNAVVNAYIHFFFYVQIAAFARLLRFRDC